MEGCGGEARSLDKPITAGGSTAITDVVGRCSGDEEGMCSGWMATREESSRESATGSPCLVDVSGLEGLLLVS